MMYINSLFTPASFQGVNSGVKLHAGQILIQYSFMGLDNEQKYNSKTMIYTEIKLFIK